MRITKKEIEFRTQIVNDTLKDLLGDNAPMVNIAGRYGYNAIELNNGIETIVTCLTKSQAYDCLMTASRLLYLVKKGGYAID